MLRAGIFGCLSAVCAAQVSAQALPIRHAFSESPDAGNEAIAFSPCGRLLAAARNKGELRLWDLETGNLLVKLDHPTGPGGFVPHRAMAFSADGKTLIVGVYNGRYCAGRIILWDVQDRRTLKRRAVLQEDAGVVAVALTPDGNTLLSAHGVRTEGRPREIRLRDLATGKSRRLASGHAMALSADGRLLVTASSDEARIWKLRSGQDTALWQETASWKTVSVSSLALSPDGKTLAISSFPERGGITFWDVAAGQLHADLKPLLDAAHPMAFSPDGRRFVAVNSDRRLRATVRITDVATGRQLSKYGHRGQFITAATWGPHGRLIASSDYDEMAVFARLLVRDASGLLAR